MFGMGFMEIFLVAIVAIIALGPEKLPTAMVDMAKFFRKIKGGIDDAKSTLDNELNISEMKAEADKFKASVADVKNIASKDMANLTSLDMDNDEKPAKSTKKIAKKVKKAEIKMEDKPDTKKENISLNEEVQA